MDRTEVTPYDLVVQVEHARAASKEEVLRLTRALEREALTVPGPVGASLQDVRYVTARTRAAYARLAEAGAAPVLYARDLPAYVAPGVSGVALDDDDLLVDVWSFVVLSEQPVVMAAVDLHAVALRGTEPPGGHPSGDDPTRGGLPGGDPSRGGLPGGDPSRGGLPGGDPSRGGLPGGDPSRGGPPGVDLRDVDQRDVDQRAGTPEDRQADRLDVERDFLVAVSRDPDVAAACLAALDARRAPGAPSQL